MRFGTVLLGAAVGGVYAAVTGREVMKSALWGAGVGGALTLIGGASVSLGRARVSVSGGNGGSHDFFAGVDPAPGSGGASNGGMNGGPLSRPTLPTAPTYDDSLQARNPVAEMGPLPVGYPWWPTS